MKKLIITEEEKNSILKMHLYEQTSTQKNKKEGGANTPKPTTTRFDPKKYLVGKTVNLYKDKENKNLQVSGCKITSFEVEGNDTVYLTFDKFTNKIQFRFDCGDKTFSNSSRTFVLYNTRLADFLFPKFCAKSSGGAVVPRADFSSLDTDLGSDIA